MAVERSKNDSNRSHRSHRSNQSSYSDSRPRKPLFIRIKNCLRLTIAFMFSNIGVCGLTIGYTIMGAFLFKTIESPKEFAKYDSVSKHRNDTINKLWNITISYNTLYPDNWTKVVKQEVVDYQAYIIQAVEDGWDGTDGTHGPSQWSLEGGFLYSMTVITTIGYGHIVPHTDAGKIMTIFYTILGMPVFLLYLANMGDILAKSLKWVYSKLCTCKKKKKDNYDVSAAWKSADVLLRGALPFMPTGAYPDDIDNQGSQVSQSEGGPRIENSRNQEYRMTQPYPNPPHLERPRVGREDPLHYLNPGDEISLASRSGSRSEKQDYTSVNIPLTVSLVIMIIVLYGGTILFQTYESWDPLSSFYFCFISLSTIGFGDYFPGTSVESIKAGNRMSFIYTALYLMFGLAFLSMCFNLMQEKVVHKVTTCINSVKCSKKQTEDS